MRKNYSLSPVCFRPIDRRVQNFGVGAVVRGGPLADQD